jgi:hypothetical protein
MINYYNTKVESEAGPPLSHVIDSQLLLWHSSHGLPAAHASCARIVYLRANVVFILELYFASKLFAAVCEAFSNVYPDKYKIWQQYLDC